jgi:hypothetical protein
VNGNKRALIRNLLGAFGIGAVATSLSDRARADVGRNWSPAQEAQDNWLDAIGNRHRQVFDTISPEGVARALTFTYTFYTANKDAYGIDSRDLGVLMIFRAGSTAFGFNDKFWSKYSPGLADRTKLVDPITKSAPVVNIYDAPDQAALLPTNGLTLNNMGKMGGRFAICSVASRKLAAALAKGTGETSDSIFAEMQANTVANARMVPAGIIALNRAQEHGFSLCYTG